MERNFKHWKNIIRPFRRRPTKEIQWTDTVVGNIDRAFGNVRRSVINQENMKLIVKETKESDAPPSTSSEQLTENNTQKKTLNKNTYNHNFDNKSKPDYKNDTNDEIGHSGENDLNKRKDIVREINTDLKNELYFETSDDQANEDEVDFKFEIQNDSDDNDSYDGNTTIDDFEIINKSDFEKIEKNLIIRKKLKEKDECAIFSQLLCKKLRALSLNNREKAMNYIDNYVYLLKNNTNVPL